MPTKKQLKQISALIGKAIIFILGKMAGRYYDPNDYTHWYND